MHDVIFENGGGEIFVSLNILLCVNVALEAANSNYFLNLIFLLRIWHNIHEDLVDHIV